MAWKFTGNANKSNNRGSKGSTGNKSSGSSSGGSSGGSRGSGRSSGSSGALTASGASGRYNVGSSKGKDFINNAAAGSTMTGGDGSKWTKNADGSTTITKDGKTYNYGGSSSSGSSSGGSSYGGGNKSYNDINKALQNNHTTTTPDWLKQAQANSQAWHTADAATRKELERKNRSLYGSHGYTYNASTGKWSAPLSAEQQQRKNSLNNKDWSTVIGGQIASGGRWQDVEDSLNNRNEKILLNGGKLDQYSNDATAQNAKNYINQMKQIEEQYQAELDRQEQIKQQQQAYYDRMADQINQQYSAMLPGLNQSYDEAARQAYINYRTAQRDLPSQLAAAGISGQGAAESSLVAQNAAYNSAYNQNELARANAIQSVENNRASALAGNSTQAAQSMADLANSLYQQRQSILAQQEAAKQNVISNLYNYGNATGNFGVNSTLDAQQTLSNIAYNKRAQDLQESQFNQTFANDKLNSNRDFYLKLWEGRGTRGATPEIAAVLGIPVGSVYAPGTYNPNYY